MREAVDLKNGRFGRLTAISAVRRVGLRTHWICKCDCGATVTVEGTNLRRGNSKSCGCLNLEVRGRGTNLRHGQSYTPEHNVWTRMKQRCLNPKADNYAWYGARGIAVCPRWLHSFEAFFEDMGPRPSSKHSIERVDPNGNYEPSNCRWATRREQVRNRRSNIHIEWHNETMCAKDWASRLGVPYRRFWTYLRKGYTVQDIAEGRAGDRGRKRHQPLPIN